MGVTPNDMPGAHRGGQDRQPPWGSDAEFSPQKAWRLICRLREDIARLKAERDRLRAKLNRR